MAEQSTRGTGIQKNKMMLFIILVVAALVCLGLMFYALLNARPRTSPVIENGAPSSRLAQQSPAASA